MKTLKDQNIENIKGFYRAENRWAKECYDELVKESGERNAGVLCDKCNAEMKTPDGDSLATFGRASSLFVPLTYYVKCHKCGFIGTVFFGWYGGELHCHCWGSCGSDQCELCGPDAD